jgi:hypothetical protein
MLKAVLIAAACAGTVVLGVAQAREDDRQGSENAELRAWDKKIDNAQRRFEVLDAFHGKAVLDRETQLVWEQSPSAQSFQWAVAVEVCNQLIVDNRLGWRLPTIQELATLVDPSAPGPTLPPGHPFDNVLSGPTETNFYWSFTTGNPINPNFAWGVSFSVDVASEPLTQSTKSNFNGHTWCVRGVAGSGVPSTQ